MAIHSGPEIPNSGLVYNLDAANPKNFGLGSVQVLVVAGGGGGGCGEGNTNGGGGGGGGAGGVIYNSNFSVTSGTAYTVTVGNGGSASTNESVAGNNGGNSVFGSLTAIGGGGGGGGGFEANNAGATGGSGGGAGGDGNTGSSLFSDGTAGQGYRGGFRTGSHFRAGAGGGGAGGVGLNGVQGANTTGLGGNGGPGLSFDISGTVSWYGGGGGGGASNNFSSGVANSVGGIGGGGAGGGATQGQNGTVNTGGGGGGGFGTGSGAGGSGIVIVRYPGPQRAIGGTVTRVGNDTVHTFTSVGSTTFTPLATGTLSGLADQTNLNGFAVATNTPTYNSSNNGSVVFNGSSNYLSAGALSGSFASFTVFIWFYPNSVANYQNPIDCNYSYNGTTGNIGPRLEMDSTGNLGWTYSNITDSNASYYGHSVVASGLAANTWHCAAITFNSTTSTTYYNGVATGLSRTAVGSPTGFIGVINNINFGRGFHLGGAERYFSGRVGMTQIYNRALSAAEVAQLFESSRGRYGV